MGLLECASGASVWRGYDYYKENKVVNLEEIETNIFTAKVSGNSSEPYSVELHIDHPRKSKCNCPHADGKRIICKHLVAAYFTVLPEEADKFYAEALAYQEEEEKRQDELSDKVCHYVWHMKKSELQDALLQLLFEGPEWQFDRFVRENGLQDDW
ncbi:MAG: SWIM zinc finger family protein [Clostridiales bacterium]|nr:SWIM zinc finger family protein [Clostridiales bacterium]